MNLLPGVLVFLPTLIWMLLWLWIRPAKGSLRLLIVGIFVGAILAVPVWFAETLVDDLVNAHNRWSRDFLEQVLGAACCEELIKFAGVIGVLKWFDKSQSHPWHVVSVALAVAIGFMTVENMVAITTAQSPMTMAISRQMTLLAGHPSYQLVMGYCLARWSIHHKMGRHHRTGWMVAAIVLPILLHGWGDFSEQLFKDEPNHGSTRDTMEFVVWIGSIAVSLIASVAILPIAAKRIRA